MITYLTDGFVFPVGKDASNGDKVTTPQTLHDLAAALGATCGCEARKVGRRKALDRGDTSAAVMARARARRFALDQEIAVALAETQTAQ